MATIAEEFEYYADLLQVPYDVTADDLKKAYEGMKLYLHPDNGGSAATLKEITNAYRTLFEHLRSKELSGVETKIPTVDVASSNGEKQTCVLGRPPKALRVFRCHHCDNAFPRKQNLERHLLWHTGEKPFACSTCQKAFRHNCLLAAHRRVHTGERPHICPAEGCTKAFREKQKLRIHMRTHTGEKPYSCSQCDKSFAQKHLLRYHEDLHSGNRRYKCSDCPAAFVRPYELMLHRNVHSSGGPVFDCAACGRCFSKKGYQLAHSKKCQAVRL